MDWSILNLRVALFDLGQGPPATKVLDYKTQMFMEASMTMHSVYLSHGPTHEASSQQAIFAVVVLSGIAATVLVLAAIVTIAL